MQSFIDTKPQPSVEATLAFAKDRHSLHFDQGGHVYFLHVHAVYLNALRLVDALGDAITPQERDDTLRIAILHDIVEEAKHTGVTAAILIAMGYAERVVAGVLRLSSRPEGVSYQENVVAIAHEGDLGVIVAKASDNENNLEPSRIEQMPPEKRSIANRYRRSLKVLASAYETMTGVAYCLPAGMDVLASGAGPAPAARRP